ncbi:unnamed protein product [Effrenium voratum]|uniref:Uncharacterized protein n=1 Tax=Effrenium voratum TaxID=2562239 RepID=A0AA36ND94_9DINO|nr:unnamed protein product [Effrenium voratum]CAJ1431530.1 unnamed protein product [Effrenium voratum]
MPGATAKHRVPPASLVVETCRSSSLCRGLHMDSYVDVRGTLANSQHHPGLRTVGGSKVHEIAATLRLKPIRAALELSDLFFCHTWGPQKSSALADFEKEHRVVIAHCTDRTHEEFALQCSRLGIVGQQDLVFVLRSLPDIPHLASTPELKAGAFGSLPTQLHVSLHPIYRERENEEFLYTLLSSTEGQALLGDWNVGVWRYQEEGNVLQEEDVAFLEPEHIIHWHRRVAPFSRNRMLVHSIRHQVLLVLVHPGDLQRQRRGSKMTDFLLAGMSEDVQRFHRAWTLLATAIAARKELEDARQQLRAQQEEAIQLQEELEEARRANEEASLVLRCVSAFAPHFPPLSHFQTGIAGLACSDEAQLIPVHLLRFTHHTVNAEFAFGEAHENNQESIFKLFWSLFTGRLHPQDLEPLYVFKHTGPDGEVGLYSRNNRRLAALLMLQALRRDHLVAVPCRVIADDDRRPSPVDGRNYEQWFQSGYDGPSRRPGCTGLGFSLWPRRAGATPSHRQYPIFNHAQSTLYDLSRLAGRLPADVSMALRSIRARPAGDQDEETLTVASNLSRP